MDVGPELDADLVAATWVEKLDPRVPAHVRAATSIRAAQAHASALQTIRDVFEVQDFAQGGLTETETLALLNHFLAYTGWLRRQLEPYVESCQGCLALYALLVRRKPTYVEHCGFVLNRQHVMYRQAGAVLIGVLTALGGLDPGMGFWRAITDGEGQAMTLRGQLQAARRG